MPGCLPQAEFYWKYCRKKKIPCLVGEQNWWRRWMHCFVHITGTVQLTKQASGCRCFSQSLQGAVGDKVAGSMWLWEKTTGCWQLHQSSSAWVKQGSDYSQLEKEAGSDHFEKNQCLRTENESTRMRYKEPALERTGKWGREEHSLGLASGSTLCSRHWWSQRSPDSPPFCC